MRTFTIFTILLLLIGLSARAQTSSDIQSKLKALEDAYNAGILSKEEYASKKAELEKQSQVLDESKQQKLKALEAAYQALVCEPTDVCDACVAEYDPGYSTDCRDGNCVVLWQP